jgi:predicted permease
MKFFENLRADVRYAVRSFSSSPGFTAAAVVAIAVGVGINTGLFSILNGMLLREVPASDAQELVSVHQLIENASQRSVRGSGSMFSFSEYEMYRNETRTLSGLLAYTLPETNATLGGSSPRVITGGFVSCNYFEVLRVAPVIGRSFAANACDSAGAAPEVVLAHDIWLTAFGGDPAIVGQSILLNRQQFTVVGVAPEGFAGIDFLKAQYFAPIPTQPLLIAGVDFVGDDHLSWLMLVGRRTEGATLSQVRTELGVIAARIDQGDSGRRTTVVTERATAFSFPEVRATVIGASAVVMAAFGLVLLIACANVANLLLARAATRGREIALRLSLGATRARLIQQFLTESALISLLGGMLGSLLAVWSFQGLVVFVLSALPPDFPLLQIDPRPDLTVLAFALALTVATGVVFGLVPAIHASKPDQYTALKQDASGSSGRAAWSRGALVGVQVAVCLVLTVSASLLLRGLYAAQSVEPGFAYRDVAVASVRLRAGGYDDARATAFNRELMARVAALPGVSAVAQTVKTPLSAGSMEFELSRSGESDYRRFFFNNVSPGYFGLLEIPLLRGRDFTEADVVDFGTSMIVSAATARRLWPGDEPVGKTLDLDIGNDNRVQFEVVGVVDDAQVQTIGVIDDNLVYVAAAPRVQLSAELLVKSDLPWVSTAEAIQVVVDSMDPELLVAVSRLEDNLDIWRTFTGLAFMLAGALGGLALVLAGIGVYGQVSYAVNLRLREIGIRVALGAGAREVFRLVMARTARPVVIGIGVGAVMCLAIGRLLSSLLFGVSAFDPLALGTAALFVLGTAFAATLLPARRALRVDPTVTLRYE